MGKKAPIIIGVVVFAAVVAAWILTLPAALRRAGNGKGAIDAIVSDFGSAGVGVYADIKTTGETMQRGIDKITATMNAAARQDAAVQSLKTKIEIQQKLRAAFVNAPANVNSANANEPKP